MHAEDRGVFLGPVAISGNKLSEKIQIGIPTDRLPTAGQVSDPTDPCL